MDIKCIRYIIYLLFMMAAFPAFSQQGAILMPLELDSAQVDFNQNYESGQMIQENFFSESLKPRSGFPINLPDFDFKNNNSFSLEFNKLNGIFDTGFRVGSMGTFYTPFLQNSTILSHDAYAFGDKIVVGGFSYGANSVFSAPFPNQNSSNFDAYGSTLFMQYKVSKNFKIETRFNVTNGPGTGF